MVKKNKRTNNPVLLVYINFVDSKPENKTKKIKIKIYSIIYTEFLFFSLCWVVNKEKKLLYDSKAIYLYCKKNLGRIPKIAPGGYPKKKPSSLFYVATSS